MNELCIWLLAVEVLGEKRRGGKRELTVFMIEMEGKEGRVVVSWEI